MISKDSIDCVTPIVKQLMFMEKLRERLQKHIKNKIYLLKKESIDNYGDDKISLRLLIKKGFKKVEIVRIDDCARLGEWIGTCDTYRENKTQKIRVCFKYYPLLKEIIEKSKIDWKVTINDEKTLNSRNHINFFPSFALLLFGIVHCIIGLASSNPNCFIVFLAIGTALIISSVIQLFCEWNFSPCRDENEY